MGLFYPITENQIKTF